MIKLFVVDDDEDILLALNFWFNKKGYDVAAFSDAQSMLSVLNSAAPDVMLLDVNLKGADGREVCRQIKNSGLYSFPIILFSANVAPDNYKSCGADAFIAKPFNLQELTRLIGAHAEV